MSEKPENDGQTSRVSERTEIIQTEFRVTKVVATFSGNRRFPADVHEGSAGLQSELVDNAISRMSTNLPAEVMRVSELQRNQGSLLSSLQAELDHLQEQKRKAMVRSTELRAEMERIRRQILLLEEECGRKNKRCIQMTNEILGLVKEGEAKRRLLCAKSSELDILRQRLSKSRQKLDDYTSSMTNTDTDSKVQTHIAQIQDRLTTLRDKKEHMKQNPEEAERICSGAVERELTDKVTQLTAESELMSKDVKQLQEKVEAIRTQQEKVKQATVVLRKRNAAQVIRLKRQVKEQLLRRRQWGEQYRLLQQNVDTLTHKLKSA